MKLRKVEDFIELPEKIQDGYYLNLRSSERIDVRPGERIDVSTGVEAYVGKTEIVTVVSDFCSSKLVYKQLGKYVELQVRIKNKDKRNIMIHPGEAIGFITVEKTRKAAIKTKATWRT